MTTVFMYEDRTQTIGIASAVNYAFFLPGRAWNTAATWNTSGSSGLWQGGNPGTYAYADRGVAGNTHGSINFGGSTMTDLVTNWVGNPTHKGLVLKQSQTATNQVLFFYSPGGQNVKVGGADVRPRMTVSYTLPISTPTDIQISPLDGNSATNAAPPVSALLAPGGVATTVVSEIYDVQSSSLVWTGQTAPRSDSGRVSITVPPGGLLVGHSYMLRSQAYDQSRYSAWTNYVNFSVNASPVDYNPVDGADDPYGDSTDASVDPSDGDEPGDFDVSTMPPAFQQPETIYVVNPNGSRNYFSSNATSSSDATTSYSDSW